MNIISWDIDTHNCKFFSVKRAGGSIAYVNTDGTTKGVITPYTCFRLYGGDKYVSFITHASKRKVMRYLRQKGLTYQKKATKRS